MPILAQTAAALEMAADLYRLRLIIALLLGAPVSFVRWDTDASGAAVAVWSVPAEAADRARKLGLSVEVD